MQLAQSNEIASARDRVRPLPALRGADLVAVEHLIDTDSLAEESLVLTRCLQCINA